MRASVVGRAWRVNEATRSPTSPISPEDVQDNDSFDTMRSWDHDEAAQGAK